MAGFIQDKVYPRLPLFAQNIAISIFGYFWKKRRFGGVFKSELVKFKDREKFSRQQWRDYQTKELRKILINAFVNVPFYKDKYTKAGFGLANFENFELSDLPKLPYLEKDELRKFGKSELMAVNYDTSGAYYSSSGSTGTPTSIYLSKKTHQTYTAAFEARGKNWAGVNKNDKRGMIGGRRILPYYKAQAPFHRNSHTEKLTYFSAYHINSDNVKDYVDGIKTNNLDFMMGYAYSNFLLAKLINEFGIEGPKLKAVLTSSEKLTEEMRNEIEKAFNCKTFDCWSGVEACAQITECEYHSLHESPDVGIIELIDKNNKVISNYGWGEAICTSLINYDQPLIRYRCGDIIKTKENKCKCGRQMKEYSEITGRIEDVITGKDGRKMVRFHGIYLGIDKIIEAQIIQQDISTIYVNMVLNYSLDKNEENLIKSRIKSQLGEVNIFLNKVDSIPRGSNGKYKAVISLV